MDVPLASAQLLTRSGDVVALRVCEMVDMPQQVVPFLKGQLLPLAKARIGKRLSNATLCCACDAAWPEGSVIAHAHTASE